MQASIRQFLRYGMATVAIMAASASAQAEEETIEIAAVTSPRQHGSPEFEAEKQRTDVKPVEWELVYKADVLAGLGGAYRGRVGYLGNLDLKLTVAGEKAFGLAGATVFAHFLHNHGSKPNARVGAAQGIDNIEVETNTGKLYQLWFQQQLFDDRVSLLAGLYDLNSEFYVTESSALFLHPALGIGSELGQTGANGPSIFPVSSLGLRLRIAPTPATYLQGVVLDGVPGDPGNPRGTHVQLNRGDGSLWVLEGGYRFAEGGEGSPASKLAVGYWRYTSRFDDQLDTDPEGAPVRRRNHGAYVIAEHPLWHHADDPGRGVTGFIRFGLAQPDVNAFDRALSAGAIYTGPFASRPDDVVGFAVAGVRYGSKARAAAELAGEPVVSREVAYELTYRFKVNDWLAVQPELQHVVTHGDTGTRATLAGVRIEASF